jgi:carbon monoxide dehydrogenase subunit G
MLLPPGGEGSRVVHVSRTFAVARPAEAVTGYLMDFGNAVRWDPGTRSCDRQDTGPVRVGSTWRNVSEFMGRQTELLYRLDVAERGHLTFTGTNTGATSTDDISVQDTTQGHSEVTYRADIVLRGLARLATPFIRRALDRVADQTVHQIQQVIDAL